MASLFELSEGKKEFRLTLEEARLLYLYQGFPVNFFPIEDLTTLEAEQAEVTDIMRLFASAGIHITLGT